MSCLLNYVCALKMDMDSRQNKICCSFIKSRAAVAWGPKQPLSIEEVDVMLPRKGEVLVKIIASGVCHTDAFTLSGEDPEGVFPCILGHEGGGIVEMAG